MSAALVACAALVMGSTASAKSEGDSVIGVFDAEGGDTFAIDAFSDHNGNHPGGTVYGQESTLVEGGAYTLERVVCVAVAGNRATVGTQIIRTNVASTPARTYQVYSFVDNAAAGTADLVGGGWVGSTEPECVIDQSDPPAGYTPVITGDFTIRDA